MKKILIVEDEAVLIKVLADNLRREGFEVLEESDGKSGLVRAIKDHPDLILLDIIMPIMDGITMLNELRNDPWGKTVSVIMLTNLSDDEKVKKSMESGATDYLVKSDWKIEDLVNKIKEKINI